MQIQGNANQEVRLSLVLRESNRLLARLALNVIDARQLASDLQDNIQEASDALALCERRGAQVAIGLARLPMQKNYWASRRGRGQMTVARCACDKTATKKFWGRSGANKTATVAFYRVAEMANLAQSKKFLIHARPRSSYAVTAATRPIGPFGRQPIRHERHPLRRPMGRHCLSTKPRLHGSSRTPNRRT